MPLGSRGKGGVKEESKAIAARSVLLKAAMVDQPNR